MSNLSADLEKTAREARWAYQDAQMESWHALTRYQDCEAAEKHLKERAEEAEAAAVASHETEGDTE